MSGALTLDDFQGIETPHGKILETDAGVWVAYGHLSEDVFRESYNWVPSDLRGGYLIGPDEELALEHRWAAPQRVPGGPDDEWQIRWGTEVTEGWLGAFPVTVLTAGGWQ